MFNKFFFAHVTSDDESRRKITVSSPHISEAREFGGACKSGK